ncbi:hypothetical protein V496_04361 [Pseudogymnoascus sp. VKM F-4515 (FW-2607)]|nr:hypothetical protein V496_04361 [Pseudogymnoascus sp. VKM F-4515 (FW-2607)]KFY93865.1 hypothetical protein V498_04202 [Pseudogymnoascus sp. VKM F-4517 (FW-2822)]
MRASVFLLAAASVAVVSAEVIEIFGAGEEGGDAFLIYPIGADATATTYLLGCPVKSATEENCIFLEPLRYTIAPGTVQMASTMRDLTLSQSCALEGKTRAICDVSYGGPGTANFESENDQVQTVFTFTGTEAEELWGPATVVTDASSIYNADRVSLAPAPTNTGDSIAPSTTGPGATSAPTSTPTGTTGTDSTATGTDSTAAETSESTGGMPQITGSCGWAVGGVAAAIALAAL